MKNAALAAFVLAGLAAGCERGSDEAPRVHPSSSAAVILPPDHLAPGELAEGADKAFGVALPRAFRVVRRFEDSVFAVGNASPEATANYLRRRIDADAVEIGPTRTIFVRARAKGAGTTAPYLRVEVGESGNTTEIVVRNITPPAIEPNLTNEERWRREGLTPDGKVLDRTKL